MKAKIRNFFLTAYNYWKHDKGEFFFCFGIGVFFTLMTGVAGLILVTLFLLLLKLPGIVIFFVLVGVSLLILVPIAVVLTGKYLSTHEDTNW